MEASSTDYEQLAFQLPALTLVTTGERCIHFFEALEAHMCLQGSKYVQDNHLDLRFWRPQPYLHCHYECKRYLPEWWFFN